MFAGQNQERLSPYFPLKERSKPVLSDHEPGPRAVETVDLEAETVVAREVFEDRTTNRRLGMQTAPFHPQFSMPKLDLPMFEGRNP